MRDISCGKCHFLILSGFLKEVGLEFQRKIKHLQAWHDIELIINFDQNPLSYVSCSKCTLKFKGAKSVPLLGKGKSELITGTFAITMAGEFLPMQLIYKGTTDRFHPRDVEFPEGFNVTHIPNDWSNEEKVKEHLEVVIFPYLRSKRGELGLPAEQRALLIYDVFKAQVTPTVLQVLEENHSAGVPVPLNFTHHYQTLDLIPSGIAKKFLNTKFEEWYARQITKQLKDSKDIYQVGCPIGGRGSIYLWLYYALPS